MDPFSLFGAWAYALVRERVAPAATAVTGLTVAAIAAAYLAGRARR